jgi:hypothetical protein
MPFGALNVREALIWIWMATPACLVLLTRSAMMRFPILFCVLLLPLSLLPVLLLPRLPTVMMKFPFRISLTVLLWFCVMVMLRFLSCTPVFLAFPPPPSLQLFALNLPCRLVAAADALLGMIYTDLLLLPPPVYQTSSMQVVLRAKHRTHFITFTSVE